MWTSCAVVFLIGLPVITLFSLIERDRRRLQTARVFRFIGPALAAINPWRVRVSGRENIDPNQVYIIVSNHQSLLDIPLIAHLRHDTKWVAKAELFRIPIFGWM